MPLPEHKLVIRSQEGVKRGELSGTADGGFLTLATAMRVNAAGTTTFTMRADNPTVAMLEDDSQVEHWRNGAMLFRSLYQGPPQYTVDDRDQELFTATCYGEKDLLNRATVAYPAATQNRAQFTGMRAESIMHILVEYNVGSGATAANGRLVDNPTDLIVVEADQGRGKPVTPQDLAGTQVLQALQTVADAGAVDFDLIKSGDRQWTFRVYDKQRGTDRSETVTFSRSRRNMGQIAYNPGLQDPRTVAIVGGSGEADAREYAVRYGPDYSVDNHREMFTGASGANGGILALQAEGDRVLQEKRIKQTLTFSPLQVTGTRFGVDYELGDLVRGTYRDIDAIYQVVGVSVSVQPGQKEDIAVELEQR